MADWVTKERERKRGVEPEPIKAPDFTPKPQPVEVPERELVPVRRRDG